MDLNLKINNNYYNFFASITIFQACLEKSIFIPRFCYHVSLKISGNCRMCLVEEKSSIKPLASCAVSLLNGMAVYTNTEVVKKSREGVLEYLLINHPLDCPICDQGGECDLQDQSAVFGSDKGRFYEKKRSVSNKNFGFLIKTFFNRCIHCSRCTRFLQELADDKSIQLLGRGKETEISNYINHFITSEVSGNIIDLCPVGALTSKPSAFKARVWELTKIYTYDINDAFAANIQIDFRGLEIIRILPKINKQLNEEWISDKTRFFFDSLNNQRLVSPYIFTKKKFKQINWSQSLTIIKNYVSSTINLLFAKKSFSFINYNFGGFLDFETALSLKFLQQQFLQSTIYKKNCQKLDYRKNFYLNLDFLTKKTVLNSVVLSYLNLRFQSPILNIRIKKLTNNFFTSIFTIGFFVKHTYNVKHLGTKNTKFNLNFLNTQTRNLHLSGEFLPATQKTHKLSNFLSDLTCYELNFSPFLSKNNFLNLNCGHIEHPQDKPPLFSPFSIELLHHIHEDCSLQTKKKFLNLLFLPTKFYFEKVSNFVNNSFMFFETAYHFSYTLPNTKEEWKILLVIYESLFNSVQNFKNNTIMKDLLRKFVLKTNFIFLQTPKLNNYVYTKNTLYFSKVNDFYNTNIVTRCSTVLSLCSKNYTKYNDYLLTKTN